MTNANSPSVIEMDTFCTKPDRVHAPLGILFKRVTSSGPKEIAICNKWGDFEAGQNVIIFARGLLNFEGQVAAYFSDEIPEGYVPVRRKGSSVIVLVESGLLMRKS